MPELPEVETVRRILDAQICGRRIAALTAQRPEVLAHPAAAEFCRAVEGARFRALGRRGKYLLLPLDTGDEIILHLRMTGQLLATPAEYPPCKHTHVIFDLDDGSQLRFIDARRFGRLWLRRAGEADDFSGLGKLGPEPLDPDIDDETLQAAMGKRRAAIKACLLDQAAVAGIGNIYADESLFEAGIRPGRAACTLSAAEWRALAAAIPRVLRRALEGDRMTPEEYLAGAAQWYREESFFHVYGRAGSPCPRCGATLLRAVIGGRGSVYCPACQKDAPQRPA